GGRSGWAGGGGAAWWARARGPAARPRTVSGSSPRRSAERGEDRESRRRPGTACTVPTWARPRVIQSSTGVVVRAGADDLLWHAPNRRGNPAPPVTGGETNHAEITCAPRRRPHRGSVPRGCRLRR